MSSYLEFLGDTLDDNLRSGEEKEKIVSLEGKYQKYNWQLVLTQNGEEIQGALTADHGEDQFSFWRSKDKFELWKKSKDNAVRDYADAVLKLDFREVEKKIQACISKTGAVLPKPCLLSFQDLPQGLAVMVKIF